MIQTHIQAILHEFEPIRKAVAQPEGIDTIEVFSIHPAGISNPADDDRDAILFFCANASWMLAADHGFPDTQNYEWITDPQWYRNSFEAWCQGMITNALIGLWEHRRSRCPKPIIARNVHTGSYHIETYETTSAYFICISYQYLNLINSYSLLNHYLIEAGSGMQQMPIATPTNEVAGQVIERAIVGKWNDICVHLDTFLATAANATNYRASKVLLNKHVGAAAELFYSSERYLHLRDATRMMVRPYYLPGEARWTIFSDQVMTFTLSHEIIHILRGDVEKPGRSTAEEMGADIGATELLANMTVSTARRGGYTPSLAGIIVGPIVFFALSQVFAYLDEFEGKYSAQELETASIAEDIKEQSALLLRAIWVAGYLAAGRWLPDPSATLFWNITGELRLLEIALKRRLWQLSGLPLSVPVESDIVLAQDAVQRAKLQTECDVMSFWERNQRRDDIPVMPSHGQHKA
jgi:hypothetical protein